MSENIDRVQSPVGLVSSRLESTDDRCARMRETGVPIRSGWGRRDGEGVKKSSECLDLEFVFKNEKLGVEGNDRFGISCK